MSKLEKIRPIFEACIANADTLLSSARELSKPTQRHIGAQPGRDAVYSHLRLFVPYCQRVQLLTTWFAMNKT